MSENSQDYAQKPQRNRAFMNSASVEVKPSVFIVETLVLSFFRTQIQLGTFTFEQQLRPPGKISSCYTYGLRCFERGRIMAYTNPRSLG